MPGWVVIGFNPAKARSPPSIRPLIPQIYFKRIGTDHEGEYNIHLDGLPAGEAKNLIRLTYATDFFKLREPRYIINFGYGNGKQHTVSVNSASVPESLRRLIEELTALADAQTV